MYTDLLKQICHQGHRKKVRKKKKKENKENRKECLGFSLLYFI